MYRRTGCLNLLIPSLCCCALAVGLSGAPAGLASGRVIPSANASPEVRAVRVLVRSGVGGLALRSKGTIRLSGIGQSATMSVAADRTLYVEPSGRNRVTAADRFFDGGLDVTADGEGITLLERASGSERVVGVFPGALRVTPSASTGLSVVNLVEIETYVAGVVSREAWPTFKTEALRGQAIAARTYVLSEMERRRQMSWDVRSTQRSQVYDGTNEGTLAIRATEAAAYTKGVVCTWETEGTPTIFSAFYGSACGGKTQPATVFGQQTSIEPLKGGVTCDYCRIAPGECYRWGPVRVQVTDIMASLSSTYPKIAKLGRISEVVVTDRTSAGRAIRWRFKNGKGQSVTVLADTARLAIGGMKVRSADCRIRVDGNELVFDRGRGFGHGVGLCQWGMQGLAERGWSAGKILRYYYPGSALTRVQ